MEIPSQKRGRVSYEQRERMLAFMVAHADFSRNRVAGPDAARKKNKLQSELATLLNSCATGASKSPEKWIKDWRSDVKAKAARIRRAHQQTGGGPGPAPDTTIEESLMAFIGYEAAEGISVYDTLEVAELNTAENDAADDIRAVENLKITKKQDRLEESLLNQAVAMEKLSQAMDNLATAINSLAVALSSMAVKTN